MSVKSVYSIRLNKQDDDLRAFLEQIQESKRPNAMKQLLKCGLAQLNGEYQQEKQLDWLAKSNEQLVHLQEQQLKLLESIQQSLHEGAVLNPVADTSTTVQQDVQEDVLSDSIVESLAMFMGDM
jgi:two-component SAPR family response regulator